MTVAEFIGAAEALAATLPSGDACVLLCQDRLNFALGFAAARLRRVACLLPSVNGATGLASLLREQRPAFTMTDATSAPTGLPTVVVASKPHGRRVAHVPLIDDDDVAAVVFTSGTTGRPQPHPKRWGSLVRGAHALRERIGFVPGSAVVGAVPPQHMWGLESTVMLPLQAGGLVHPSTPLLPDDVAAATSSCPSPCWLVLTPIHVRAALRAGVAPAALCGVLSAAAPLDRDDAAAYEALAKAPVVEIYGSSETGAIATRRPAIDDRFVPLPGVRLSPGERVLRIEGGHIADVATLPDDAVVADDGTFVLAGRQGDLVKVAGKRASLAALNQALRRIPGVVDGEFVVVPRAGRLASRLGALVVAPSVAPVIILAALREQIDPVFLPRPLLQVDALPRDAVGKVPRDALEQLCVVAAARADAPGGR